MIDTSHDPLPLRALPKQIPATCYNLVRLALLRIGKPLRIVLTRHRGLEVVLGDDAWRCVDSFAGDQLIMVWHTFAAAHRDNLVEPVACELVLYHHCAGLVMGSALTDVEDVVDALLHGPDAHACHTP